MTDERQEASPEDAGEPDAWKEIADGYATAGADVRGSVNGKGPLTKEETEAVADLLTRAAVIMRRFGHPAPTEEALRDYARLHNEQVAIIDGLVNVIADQDEALEDALREAYIAGFQHARADIAADRQDMEHGIRVMLDAARTTERT